MDLNGLREIFSTIGHVILGPLALGAGTYMIIKIADWYKNRKIHTSIQLTTEKNERIQELLIELRILLKADRVYLSMFHNGIKYVDGSEILKKSRTHESVAAGVAYDAQYYQNINISLIQEEMKLVSQEGPSFVNVSELPDCKFKRMLVSRSIKHIARCAVKKQGDMIGFLGLDYVKEMPDAPENIQDLCKYAGIIEQVLSSYR